MVEILALVEGTEAETFRARKLFRWPYSRSVEVAMKIGSSLHFRMRWRQRVGPYSPRVIKYVCMAITNGNVRKHWNDEQGVLVGLMYQGRKLCVIGAPSGEYGEEEFLLQTVLSVEEASQCGWREMNMRIPRELKRGICQVCGDRCIPMTTGDNWYNKRKEAYESVVVCPECDQRLKKEAYRRAALNSDHYHLLVEAKWNSSDTTQSGAPSF